MFGQLKSCLFNVFLSVESFVATAANQISLLETTKKPELIWGRGLTPEGQLCLSSLYV